MRHTAKKLILSVTVLGLAGCNSLFDQHVKCNDETANSLIYQVLKDDLNNSLESQLKDLIRQSQINDLDPAKLKLSAQNIQYVLADSRTDFIDPHSPKTTCSVDLTVTLPSDLIKKSDEARNKVDRWSVESQADDIGLDYENKKISFYYNSISIMLNLVLEYQLQPADSGKKIFAHMKNTSNLQTLLSDTLTYAFLKPQIEKNEIRNIEANKQAVVPESTYAEPMDTTAIEPADAAAEAANYYAE